MAEKFVQIQPDGTEKEREFAVATAGAGDAGRGVALDGSGKLDPSVLPVGVGADVITVLAFENLAAGDFVNIFLDTGVSKARKADATAYAKRATGFVLSAVTAGQSASVYKEGSNTQLSGLTIGAEYFLSNSTPGAATAAPVTTADHILQALGTAISATAIDFEAARPVIRA